jgi:hypothetical protein
LCYEPQTSSGVGKSKPQWHIVTSRDNGAECHFLKQENRRFLSSAVVAFLGDDGGGIINIKN